MARLSPGGDVSLGDVHNHIEPYKNHIEPCKKPYQKKIDRGEKKNISSTVMLNMFAAIFPWLKTMAFPQAHELFSNGQQIWPIYHKSLTGFKAILGGILVLNQIWGDLGWGRYNLPRQIQKHPGTKLLKKDEPLKMPRKLTEHGTVSAKRTNLQPSFSISTVTSNKITPWPFKTHHVFLLKD